MRLFGYTINKSRDLIPIAIFAVPYLELLSLLVLYVKQGKPRIVSKGIKHAFAIFTIIFIYSLVNCTLLGYGYSKTVQQYLLIGGFLFLYGLYFRFRNNDLEYIFKQYLKASYFISIVGFIQLFIYFFTGVDVFVFFSTNGTPEIAPRVLRLSAYCAEGGQLGTILSPAVVYIIYFRDKWNVLLKKKWIILAAAILTAGSTMALTVALCLYFRFISRKKIIDYFVIAMVALFGGSILTIANSEKDLIESNNPIYPLYQRVQGLCVVAESLDDINVIENTHLSVYALLSNTWVARHAPNRILGTGLGTHEYNYTNVYKSSSHNYYGQNKEDGYSLLNRIFSEFGILGIIFYLCIVFRHLDRNDIIGFSCFFFLLGSFLRGGYYFAFGTIFFHILFFLAKERYYKRSKYLN